MTRPIVLGTALSVPLIPIHFILADRASIALGAVTLSIVAGAYIGFAAQDGRRSAIAAEGAAALLFGSAALAGLLGWPLAIPLALIVHAGWDLMHHRQRVGARIPAGYIPFCVVVDLAVAGALLIRYSAA